MSEELYGWVGLVVIVGSADLCADVVAPAHSLVATEGLRCEVCLDACKVLREGRHIIVVDELGNVEYALARLNVDWDRDIGTLLSQGEASKQRKREKLEGPHLDRLLVVN